MCPSLEQLERLAAGALPEPELGDLQQHVAACEPCRASLREIQANLAIAARLAEGAAAPAPDGAAEPTRTLNPVPWPQRETAVGPFRILETLGEGGFGVVYLAEQTSPLRRRVALKVIKPGMDTARVIARFEAERQALAMMDHPNIAKVLDAGTTEQGARPYFVMEHVPGESITEYCDRHKLSTRARLELFIPVCEAVQHAHTKGIIHRDLKPSNVLVVVRQGQQPIPKVIDFGVAKALHGPLGERTIFTEQGQLIGTPEYMSPEQAEMGPLDIDTRTDVYSLGVMLYELLSGARPFDLRGTSLVNMVRILREQEPVRPSTRLTSSGEAAARVAELRRTRPDALTRELKRELEWIPLKALRKDRTERYQTAADLARDLRNYLEGRPLLAGPETATYQLRKFVRRHRGPVGIGLVVAAAVVASGIVSLHFAFREAAARLAEQRQRHTAERVVAVLTEMLEGVRAEVALGRDTKILRGVLDETATRIGRGEFKDQPEVELQLRDVMALSYNAIGETRSAEPIAGEALRMAESMGPGNDRAVARSLGTLAQVLYGAGRPDDAEAAAERALMVQRRLHAGDHEELVDALIRVSHMRRIAGDPGRAEGAAADAMDMAERLYPGGHEAQARALDELASVHKDLGQYSDAEPLYSRALEIERRVRPPDHPEIGRALNNLALIENRMGRPAQAEALYREALSLTERAHSGDHPDLAACLDNLANVLSELRRPEEAEPLYRRSLDMRRRLSAGDHPMVVIGLRNLAGFLGSNARASEAEPLCVEALEMSRRCFKGDHDEIATSLNSLGRLHIQLNQPGAAEPLFDEALAMLRRLYPDGHPSLAVALNNLARARQDLGRMAEAEPLYAEALDMRRLLYPNGHPNVVFSLTKLGEVRARLGRRADAVVLFEEALPMARRLLRADQPELTSLLDDLGSTLTDLDRAGEAEPILEESLNARKARAHGDTREVASSLYELGRCKLALAKKDEAKALLMEAAAMAERVFPPGHARRVTITEAAAKLGS